MQHTGNNLSGQVKNIKNKKAKGFTLLELLVVIVLVGIITTFAVLSAGGGTISRELGEEAKRLHALISLAKEEAIIQSREIALELEGNQYHFLTFVEATWIPMEAKVFRKRTLAEAFEISVDLQSEQALFKEKDENLKRLYFLSSGEQTPFEIRLNTKERKNERYIIKGGFAGNVQLEQQNDDYYPG